MSLKVPSLDDFGLSTRRGFLSDDPPLTAFDNAYFAQWDALVSDLPNLISTHAVRQKIKSLPILDAAKLSTRLEYQRAYVVLAFLVHAYVWAGGSDSERKPEEVVPPQLAEPFLKVCEVLDTEPVLSYAGLCLWNWRASEAARVSEGGFYELDTLTSLGTFTGSCGEDAFYHVPVLIEAEGGPLLAILLDALQATENHDVETVKKAFETSAETFKRMTHHLPKMYAKLDADAFYHQLRPFLAGGKGMESKGLKRGVVFQRSNGTEYVAQCIGGSAGQSSLFQFLDIVLGTEHKAPVGSKQTLFQEMRAYMPGKHREFLEKVSELPTLRGFVEENPMDERLTEAYNECMKQLRLWRSTHIAIVSKYIVGPARKEAGDRASMNAHTEEDGSGMSKSGDNGLLGTGGSALVPFLRQSRDETVGVSPKEI